MKRKCELGLKCPHQNQREHISEFYHGEVETFKPQRRCTVCRKFGHNIAKCTDPRAQKERERRAELRQRTKEKQPVVIHPVKKPAPTPSQYTEERIAQDRAYERVLEEDRIRSEELEIQEAIRLSQKLNREETARQELQLIENYKKRARTDNFSYTLQFRCPSEVLVYNFSPQETWDDVFKLLISHQSIKDDTDSEEWILCDPLNPENPVILAQGTEMITSQKGTLLECFSERKSVRASFVLSVQ